MVGIESSREILGGKDRIAGTRISVDLVYSYVIGDNIERIFVDYPHLNEKQVKHAVDYISQKANKAEKYLVAPSAKA